MPNTIQRPRIATVNGREVRTVYADMQAPIDGKLTGYASVFDAPYDMGAYTETMARGAFTATLASRPDVQLLANHDGLPYARTTVPQGQPGHLSLTEDYHGLRVDAQLDPNDPDAQKLVSKIRSGLLDQMSFAFRVTKQEWSNDNAVRTIQAVNLDRGDVSVVNYGASPTTSVDARARGRRNGRAPLNLYQARARALALRDLRIRDEAGRRR